MGTYTDGTTGRVAYQHRLKAALGDDGSGFTKEAMLYLPAPTDWAARKIRSLAEGAGGWVREKAKSYITPYVSEAAAAAAPKIVQKTLGMSMEEARRMAQKAKAMSSIFGGVSAEDIKSMAPRIKQVMGLVKDPKRMKMLQQMSKWMTPGRWETIQSILGPVGKIMGFFRKPAPQWLRQLVQPFQDFFTDPRAMLGRHGGDPYARRGSI